jgi:YD repeat-containing protein
MPKHRTDRRPVRTGHPGLLFVARHRRRARHHSAHAAQQIVETVARPDANGGNHTGGTSRTWRLLLGSRDRSGGSVEWTYDADGRLVSERWLGDDEDRTTTLWYKDADDTASLDQPDSTDTDSSGDEPTPPDAAS